LFLEQNGFNARSKTTYGILEELDPMMTGGISFKDFVKAMSVKPGKN
jgi:Ca2+-binding EF-hand superfamily protein